MLEYTRYNKVYPKFRGFTRVVRHLFDSKIHDIAESFYGQWSIIVLR